MKCETKNCSAEATYEYDGMELCSDHVSARAKTKPNYYAKEG